PQGSSIGRRSRNPARWPPSTMRRISWGPVSIRVRTGRQEASTARSTISRWGFGTLVSISEKYRQPMGPGAQRNSSVPTRFPSPSITVYRPTGMTGTSMGSRSGAEGHQCVPHRALDLLPLEQPPQPHPHLALVQDGLGHAAHQEEGPEHGLPAGHLQALRGSPPTAGPHREGEGRFL